MSPALVVGLVLSGLALAVLAVGLGALVREMFRPPWWDQTAQHEKAWRTFQRNWERGRP